MCGRKLHAFKLQNMYVIGTIKFLFSLFVHTCTAVDRVMSHDIMRTTITEINRLLHTESNTIQLAVCES